MSENPYVPKDFSHITATPKIGALIIVTDSGPATESTTYEYSSVSEALGHFERIQHQRRYLNRDQWVNEPDGVHFHNILVLGTEDPGNPEKVVRSTRVVTPDGEWTDKVAHLWVTGGEPHWITTRGDYKDESQPVVNYRFA